MARPCSACRNPQRAEIDAALVAGASYRDVAGQYGVSKSALERHRDHISAAIAKATASAEATELAHGEDLALRMAAQEARAEELFREARTVLRRAKRKRQPDLALEAIRTAATTLREINRSLSLAAHVGDAKAQRDLERSRLELEEELRERLGRVGLHAVV